ncbi:unnamed protein product [Ilex paraguariensis]|uniref:Uncharacterized protein n=1 Tax=Ilex paraguariensis TaxID=185542 RepID=A0ABC8SHF0_9AQUA
MPSWWRKSSSKKVKKKANKESFIDTIHRKLKIASEVKCTGRGRSGISRRHCSDGVSEKGSQSRAVSRSPSPSTQVACCQTFVERPHGQPITLPGAKVTNQLCVNSEDDASTKELPDKGSKPLLFPPLPTPECVGNCLDPTDAEGVLVTTSVSSDISIESDDPSDSRLLSPQASDYENEKKLP